MEQRPHHRSEPTEDDLRSMLEKREAAQAAERNRLGGKVSRVIAAVFAVAAIAFFSSSGNREAVASIFREPDPGQDTPADGEVSMESQLMKAATGIDASAFGSPDGKVVSKEDVEFAAELLNFSRGPQARDVHPAGAGDGKTGDKDQAGEEER